jgi:hypothetical protein
MTTYSFTDVQCTINGPAGLVALGDPANNSNFQLGSGAGNAEEGITVEMTEDKDTMTLGADGTLMHSLHAAIGGRMTVRLLKTSPTNMQLSEMYKAQQTSAALWGNNIITIDDKARGDKIQGTQMAFMRFPNVVYAKDGNVMEWIFGGLIVQTLGNAVLTNSNIGTTTVGL